MPELQEGGELKTGKLGVMELDFENMSEADWARILEGVEEYISKAAGDKFTRFFEEVLFRVNSFPQDGETIH